MEQQSYNFISSAKHSVQRPTIAFALPMSRVLFTATSTSDLRTVNSSRKIPEKEIKIEQNNWALIDMQNLQKGVAEQGWKIHWPSFRKYLRKVHNVNCAVVFMGYVNELRLLYDAISKAGFSLEFRKVIRLKNGAIEGGNIDADLASFAMDHKNLYKKAIVVADDGDYRRTLESLNRQKKLDVVISTHHIDRTSKLIKEILEPEQLISIHSLRKSIALRF